MYHLVPNRENFDLQVDNGSCNDQWMFEGFL